MLHQNFFSLRVANEDMLIFFEDTKDIVSILAPYAFMHIKITMSKRV